MSAPKTDGSLYVTPCYALRWWVREVAVGVGMTFGLGELCFRAARAISVVLQPQFRKSTAQARLQIVLGALLYCCRHGGLFGLRHLSQLPYSARGLRVGDVGCPRKAAPICTCRDPGQGRDVSKEKMHTLLDVLLLKSQSQGLVLN